MKKIALIILATLVLNFGLMAVPVATGQAQELKGMEFSVTKNLKLPGDKDQPASYFKVNGKTTESPIVELAKKIIEFATYTIGSIAVILVIVSGFMMMVSQGNQQKLDQAKEVFRFALIGVIVVLLSYILTIFVQSIFA